MTGEIDSLEKKSYERFPQPHNFGRTKSPRTIMNMMCMYMPH